MTDAPRKPEDREVIDLGESNFVALLDTLLKQPAMDPEFRRRVESVREYAAAPAAADGPFLTVLLRTQGRRPEPFKDALLCLAAQTDEDFEVVVLEHDATAADAEATRETIARQPKSLRDRITVHEVRGGTRARPLNVGIEVAKGRYIAVYDDDDLVFANWVEEFRAAAKHHDGRLVRAVVANQKVRPEQWPSGQLGFRTESWPAAEYDKEFDQLRHLLVNRSPFMTWGFPAALFNRYGLRFDEELTVCEDWDVILRGSIACGVTEIDALTSIYRRWQGGESSYTRHDRQAWLDSEERVIDRIDRAVLMAPPGSMRQIRELVLFDETMRNYRFLFNGHELRRPIRWAWRAMEPSVRLAIRVRGKLLRVLAARRRSRS